MLSDIRQNCSPRRYHWTFTWTARNASGYVAATKASETHCQKMAVKSA